MTLVALSHYANIGFAVIVPTVTADAVTNRGYHNVYRLPAKDSRPAGSLPVQRSKVSAAFRRSPSLRRRLWLRRRARVRHGRASRTTTLPTSCSFRPTRPIPAQAARTVLDRSPGYVFLAGKTKEMGPVAEALRLAGYTGEFGAADGFYNADTITRYAKTLDGAYVASPMPPLDRIPSAAQLVTDFQREVTQITTFSAYGYAAAQLIISASQRGSASDPFGAVDRAAARRHVYDAHRTVHLQRQRRSADSQHLSVHHRRRRIQVRSAGCANRLRSLTSPGRRRVRPREVSRSEPASFRRALRRR